MNAVVIATYNEAQNAPQLVTQIRKLQPNVLIVMVDDNSPDNTAGIVGALNDAKIHIVIRDSRVRGYGTAVRDGLLKAVALGADRVATMDADFSHDPKDLNAMLAGLEENDVTIGSRYIGGVRILNWPMKRLLLSLFANFYVRLILGLSVTDCTSGYRAYRASLLQSMNLETIHSNGYSFLVEMLWRAHRRNARLKELPIIFEERREGESKMSGAVIRESIFMPWKLRLWR